MAARAGLLFPVPYSLLLLGFPVLSVGAAALAKLRELETAGGRLLVLGSGVVALFALRALQCHDFPHLSILTDRAPWPCYYRTITRGFCQCW